VAHALNLPVSFVIRKHRWVRARTQKPSPCRGGAERQGGRWFGVGIDPNIITASFKT